MEKHEDRLILVTAATGRQGGAALGRLRKKAFQFESWHAIPISRRLGFWRNLAWKLSEAI